MRVEPVIQPHHNDVPGSRQPLSVVRFQFFVRPRCIPAAVNLNQHRALPVVVDPRRPDAEIEHILARNAVAPVVNEAFLVVIPARTRRHRTRVRVTGMPRTLPYCVSTTPLLSDEIRIGPATTGFLTAGAEACTGT